MLRPAGARSWAGSIPVAAVARWAACSRAWSCWRWRRMGTRSAGVVPPKMACSSPVASAISRQESLTGQPAQMALAACSAAWSSGSG
jgi:hypothetical protein